jgi:hypothetical protein
MHTHRTPWSYGREPYSVYGVRYICVHTGTYRPYAAQYFDPFENVELGMLGYCNNTCPVTGIIVVQYE